MRLIDADALLKHEIEADRMGAMLVVGKGYILSAPEVDAVPVVRGEWKLLDECSNAGVYCSVCHKAVFRERAWYKNVHIQSKFCPNCGARMDGEE